MKRAWTTVGAVCGVLVGLAQAGDWPQWRGPNRDSVSSDTVPVWQGEVGPKKLWSAAFGEGHASPVAADGRVFVHSKDKNDELVTALDAKTGQQLWQHRYAAPFASPFGSGPRATPTLEGGRLFTLGATGKLHCLDAEKGTVIWSADTLADFSAKNLFFGVSSSPIVDGDRLLVLVGGPTASVVAFNKTDGKVLWKAGTDRASYASPQMVSLPGLGRQAVFVTFQEVAALAPKTGSVSWNWPLKTKNDENAVTPLAVGDTVVISSVSEGLQCLRPKKAEAADKVEKPERVWHNRRINCYFSTPVLANGLLFAVHGAPAQLSCVDPADGSVKWTHPPEVGLLKPGVGLLHGTLIALADGKLLLMSDTGRLTLLEATATGYKPLASAKVCGSTWVHPALSGGRLFVKDSEGLHALDVSAAKSGN